MLHQMSISTRGRDQWLDITREIQQTVSKSNVMEGIAIVFIPHTTAGVTINENADPSVTKDLTMELNKIVPWNDGYSHMEGNSAAHLKSTLVGPELSVVIHRGKLILGTWQGIYFCEFDGPRNRKYFIKIIDG